MKGRMWFAPHPRPLSPKGARGARHSLRESLTGLWLKGLRLRLIGFSPPRSRTLPPSRPAPLLIGLPCSIAVTFFSAADSEWPRSA